MAPPPPRSPASMFSVAALSSSMQDMLLQAAYEGDLRLLKRLVRALDKGRGRLREAVEAAKTDGGDGALHLAAGAVRLEVCSYLVEGLRVDVNAVDDKGRTPLIFAVLSENIAVVKYLLDHGADPDKADVDGLAPLHSAAGIGDCEMVELLLAKGAYVDPLAIECGTPLHIACKERQAGAMKILLDHNADCNKAYMMYGVYGMTPLFQAVNVSSVKCVKLLVEAGADISSDCVLTALIDSNLGNKGSTECLNFLLDSGASLNASDDDEYEFRVRYFEKQIERVHGIRKFTIAIVFHRQWSQEAGVESGMLEDYVACLCGAGPTPGITRSLAPEHQPKLIKLAIATCLKLQRQDKHGIKRKIAQLKSLGSKAVEKEDYFSASTFYSKAMDLDPDDATLLSNRSLCWLRMGEGEKALRDAVACREMRPEWPKAWYRQGAALLLLKDYKSACEALFGGFKLDPENAEIENALRKAMESLKISQSTAAK